jgi:hypothetical protein
MIDEKRLAVSAFSANGPVGAASGRGRPWMVNADSGGPI